MTREPEFLAEVQFMLTRIASHAIGWFVAALSIHVRAEPHVSHCVPTAVAPGATSSLTLHGNGFSEPLRIWTSFPSAVKILSVGSKRIEVSITVDERASLGDAGIAIATLEGACDPVLILVDDLPNVSDDCDNHSMDKALFIKTLCGIDGASDGSKADFYRFDAAAGQRIAMDCWASRLGSKFDPLIRMLDEKGNEILSVDDDLSHGLDCRFSHTFATAGRYFLELRDSQYSTGGRYRLRVGDFPLIDGAYPLAGRIGETRLFSFTPIDTAITDSVLSVLPSDPLSSFAYLGAKISGGRSSAWAKVMVGSQPENCEGEPNNKSDQASQVIIPCGISAQLESPGDIDHFEFLAAKGQSVRFAATTIRLGSPTLLDMKLLDASGESLKATTVSDDDEWSFEHTFAADGVYRLEVADLLRRGGRTFTYHVAISTNRSFELAIKQHPTARDRFAMETSIGACAIDIQAARFGYDGPIELSLQDVGTGRPVAGVTLHNAIIPERASEACIYLTAMSNLTPDTFAHARILGRTSEGLRYESLARSSQFLRSRTPQSSVPPPWRDGLISICGVTAREPFFTVTAAEDSAQYFGPLGTGTAILSLARKASDFKDAVTIVTEQLPTGFSVSTKIDKDKYLLTLTGPRDIVRDRLVVRLLVFANFNERGCYQTMEIPFDFVTP